MAKKSESKKQIVFLIILVFFVALFVTVYFAQERHIGKRIITRGDRAPEFRLPSLEGKSVGLSDFRGKVVMVHFWATWCPPCVEEMPTLDKLSREFTGKNFQLLAVSADEGGADTVSAFMTRNRLSIPVLLDTERTVAGLYGTFKFPETYILDGQGIVRYKAIGPRDWGNPANLKIVQDIFDAR